VRRKLLLPKRKIRARSFEKLRSRSQEKSIPVLANVAVLCGTALCKLNAINDFILQVRLSGKAL